MEARTLDDLIQGVRDLITVKRVYGEPYEKNGLTVIPAASVRGGGGGGEGRGEGSDPHGSGSGSGGGFGMVARPSGAWVIRGDDVTWRPAVDVNRIVLGGQLVGLVAILVAGRVLLALAGNERHRLSLAGLREHLPAVPRSVPSLPSLPWRS
jgi:uncharacterized spore protein YtfJ